MLDSGEAYQLGTSKRESGCDEDGAETFEAVWEGSWIVKEASAVIFAVSS